MTSQQLRALELLESIRRKRRRDVNPSNLLDSTPVTSNWGTKLDRNSHNVSVGKLTTPYQYTETINYNGYKRRIISRNPLYIDDDGDLIDEEADLKELGAEPIEENPYKDIKLEELYRPLNAAADLPTHPRMARPYLEPGLDDMIQQSEENLRKEQRVLFSMNELFIKYRGDYDWMPTGMANTEYDEIVMQAATEKINGNTYGEQDTDSLVKMFQPPPHPSHFPPMPPGEDVLRTLQSYVGKQEEVVRLQNELYLGLLKARRMRKEVYGWCKAEGHVGEMSDGEDWVDLQEWGLKPGDLIKGKEEDENEGNNDERRGRRRGAARDRDR